MKKPIKGLVSGLILFVVIAPTANAQPTGRWWEGWGQGMSEYGFQDRAGNQVYIGCPEDRGASISVYFEGKPARSLARIDFYVDGEKAAQFHADEDGDIQTESRVDSANFKYLWSLIRKGKRLQVSSGGRSASFPLSGSASVLPATPCLTGW